MTTNVSTSDTAVAANPLGLLRGAGYLVERNLILYRHTWYLLLAEMFEPVLYLVSIGVGIGGLIGASTGLGGASYAAFVAPGLLATAAMNGAMNETTFNMFAKLRLQRTYDSIGATPMTARHIALGETAWALLRGTLVTTGFLVVVTVLGLSRSAEVLLVLPGAAVIGFAFAAAGLVVVTYLRGWQDMQYIQLAMLPMFLFATTFFPLEVYPGWLQPAIACLPLYQSIELLRQPALGHLGVGVAVAAVYLLVFGVLCLWWASRRIEALLTH